MEAITNLATETITNLATTARKSVFGESDPKAQSSTKPPAGTAPEKDTKESPHDSGNVPEQPVTALGKDTEGSPHDSSIVPEQPVTAPGKDSKESPHDLGNVPEQLVTAPGLQSPLTGPAVTGTAEAPHDSGNKPEQIQASGTADTTETLPSSSIPASKIDNPDPSKPSEMKSALAAHDAATTTNPSTASMAAKTGTESQPPKTSTATTPSHSALFGLGPDAEGGASSDAIHPPKRSAEFSGTIDEAGKSTGKQAEVKKNRLDGDDTGGYVGLKKAAMEEEAKRTNGDAASGSKLSEDEYRESRFTREQKNSLAREISPGEMPDGTHRKSIAEALPQGHTFSRKNTNNSNRKNTMNSSGKNTNTSSGEKSGGGFRDRLKEKFRSKK